MTTFVKVKGVKRWRHPKTKRWYAYHRASGKRLNAEFGTAEFFQELAEIERASKIAAPTPGTLGLVIHEYLRSPDWSALRPATRISYEKAFRVLAPLNDMPLVRTDRSFVFALRDKKLLPKHGVWLANYCVTVLSILFKFATDRGWMKVNPLAERVKKIRQPRENGAGNRPWSEAECHVVLDRAPAHIRLPIALAMCAGLRRADFLTITLASVRNDQITIRTSKRGVPVAVPIHPILADAIAHRPRSNSDILCVGARGEPWTAMGFNASWGKFRRALEAEGVIGRGLTCHGLRHTLGTRLREAGADDRTIADILGQRSTSMARHYSENATLPDHAKALVSGLNLTGKGVAELSTLTD
ncbi:tyrosine-type recombinase/integrase [Methylocystis sp.]|uniref:tyrosine-type recombinase/integrase n=1 Tax=Methylocystis sp. TaxID=1911079 RepID=UPI003D153569